MEGVTPTKGKAAVELQPVASLDEKRAALMEAAIQKAIGVDLPSYMQKMMMGREPNAPEFKGAVLGLALIADRNTRDFESRIAWLERPWWRRWFRRRPKQTGT